MHHIEVAPQTPGIATFRPMALPGTGVYVKAGVMPSSSSEPDETSSQGVRAGWLPTSAAALALVGSVTILVVQVTVTNDAEAASRTCGSAFDAITDRSGWETWWARDLDEPDESVRAALIRTDLCPAAINQRIVLASVVGALGILLATLARLRATGGRTTHRADRVAGDQFVRLGRATSWTGAVLSIAGVVAIVALVADADSTLFLYVDRPVVGVVGLIVLMPTIALFVIGRALVLVGTYLARVEDRVDA